MFGSQDRKQIYINPNVFDLVELNVCYATDPLFLNSLKLIEENFQDKEDSLLKKSSKAKEFNVAVLFNALIIVSKFYVRGYIV